MWDWGGMSWSGCLGGGATKVVFYTDRETKVDVGRQRHPSGGVSAKEMVIGLEGVELGADGKVRQVARLV